MDSYSFICALRRFFSIRGPPSLLRCDRRTHFVGAKSELDEALKEMDHKALAKYIVEQNCEWVFNPPHASLKEAASATGQKSLLTFFEKNSNVNATEKRVQQPLLSGKESNIIAKGDGNDLTVVSQSPQATSIETQTS